MSTVLDIITTALIKAGIQAQGESVSAEDGDYALAEFNTLLDSWNAAKQNIFAMALETFTITPNHQPHTIGLTGDSPDWVITTNRPTKIENAVLILTGSTPATRESLRIRDAEWWARQTIPTLTSTLPSDLYYAPTWPKGSVYLWPVGTVAYQVALEFLAPLTQPLTLATTFSMPPGYQDAITLTLAERLLIGDRPPDQTLAEAARKARSVIQSVNSKAPLIGTRESGMPSVGRGGISRSDFESGQF